MQKGTVYNFYKDLPGWAKGVTVVTILLALIVTVYQIRKWLKNRPPRVTYPNGGQGLPAGFDPKPYAKTLHDTMSGPNLTISPQRDAIVLKVSTLPTDDMFVAVYDVFNQLYMSEGDGTLRDWINDEVTLPYGLKGAMEMRFNKLNLK